MIKFFAARSLWAASRNATIAAVGYYVLAAVQPTFTTLGTGVLFWLFILVAASAPETLKPNGDVQARLASFFSWARRST
jgi:hypothetical protein